MPTTPTKFSNWIEFSQQLKSARRSFCWKIYGPALSKNFRFIDSIFALKFKALFSAHSLFHRLALRSLYHIRREFIFIESERKFLVWGGHSQLVGDRKNEEKFHWIDEVFPIAVLCSAPFPSHLAAFISHADARPFYLITEIASISRVLCLIRASAFKITTTERRGVGIMAIHEPVAGCLCTQVYISKFPL